MTRLLLLLLLLPGPGLAAVPLPLEVEVTPTAEQAALDRVAARFATLWSAGDVSGIAALLSSDGVRLQLGQGGHATVGVRQATAAIRDFHQAFRTTGARVRRVSEVSATPRRGFAELECSATEGSRDETGYSVFVAFLLEGSDWRVSEIRVLR